MSVLPVGFGSSSGSYSIANSLRFRASASAYLSRTFGAPTDNKKWTWSGWVKRGQIGTSQTLFSSYSAATDYFDFRFNPSDQLYVQNRLGGTNLLVANTTAVFRDPSAHMHVVFVFDSSNGTAANRNLLYINGTNITWSANSGSGDSCAWNRSAYSSDIGASHTAGLWAALDGLLSEIYFIDGQALDPSYFGETNTDGVWVPKAYSGTYGTNGFHLDFSDATSTTTLGYDAAGSNDWTCNNISLTAGVTYDHMVDTPTDNFATLNPLDVHTNIAHTLLDGNLTGSKTGAAGNAFAWSHGTIGINSSTPKTYFEATITSCNNAGASPFIGVSTRAAMPASVNNTPPAEFYYTSAGATSGTIGCAFDPATGKVWFRNTSGTWVSGDPVAGTSPSHSGLNILNVLSASYHDGTAFGFHSCNFGQRPFAYTPPTGFKALSTANLPAVAITNPREHFDVKTRAGGGGNSTVSGIQFQPDLVWIKNRSAAWNNNLYDAIRGTGKVLFSDLTDAENTNSIYGYLSAFASGGYSFTAGSTSSNLTDQTGSNYVDWLWKANGAGVSNTDGSITSTVSTNTTAGFSIVTWTGTGAANPTLGHGLGVAPKMIIEKGRQAGSGPYNWTVQHASLGWANELFLNTTSAVNASGPGVAPTSTVYSASDLNYAGESGVQYVAYCFAEIPGYSKFGSYTGNASTDGPFVFCGFRPKYVLIKGATIATSWILYDTARNAYNVVDLALYPNLSAVEDSAPGDIDITANGFKVRGGTGVSVNNSGETYIFAAFAEFPFGGSNVSPSPAR